MGSRSALVAVALCLFVLGCSEFQQARSDHALGRSTPLAEGEVAPRTLATQVLAPVKALPYGETIFPVLVTVLGGILTHRRGRKIRKGEVTTTVPASGTFGSAVGIESIIQLLTTVGRGAFDVGKHGSGLRRFWKVGVASAAALGVTAASNPEASAFISGNPLVAAMMVGITAAVASLEKTSQKVLPVVPPPA